MILEYVGLAGGFLIALSLLPQLIKTWKTKSAKDISFMRTLITLLGLILYFIYALINSVLPLLIFAMVESIMLIILMLMKIKFDR